jgi:deoxyribodipyrimidine photo-lyase
MTALLWFRQNLRLHDNPPLVQAVEDSQRGILPVYLYNEKPPHRELGGASKWALHNALTHLDQRLSTEYQQTLYVEKVDDTDALIQRLVNIAQDVGADTIYTEQRWEPGATQLEADLRDATFKKNINLVLVNASLLQPAMNGCKDNGDPYLVFTPYWKKQIGHLREALREVMDAPENIPVIPDLDKLYQQCDLDSLDLLPTIKWYEQMATQWELSEVAGQKKLDTFLDGYATDYSETRNLPAIDGTSSMSPYLHFGVMSVVDIFHQVQTKINRIRKEEHIDSLNTYLSELGWREFAHHLLYYFPHTLEKALKEKYQNFPWQPDENYLKAWQAGQTGYPIVDAGMRQLYATGWMHNRVRMIVGSLLVKHLLQPWQEGESWFWDTLVDADVASNTLGWQWIAGCGADASPYFRVFNPISQSEKFDKDGEYIRKWVPELKNVPTEHIHTPWEMSTSQQARYKVSIGTDYPAPIIEHKAGRQRALDAFEKVKSNK